MCKGVQRREGSEWAGPARRASWEYWALLDCKGFLRHRGKE